MQLNKIIVILILIFGSIKLNAQPSPKKNTSQISISFNDCKKNQLSFISNDSIHFFSKNKKYKLKFDLINQISKDKNIINVISNKYNFSNNFYCFDFNKNTFLLKYNYLISYNNNPIRKSVFKIHFTKGEKKMTVLINFTGLKEEIKIKALNIFFKKGIFKITDPNNPELIKVID